MLLSSKGTRKGAAMEVSRWIEHWAGWAPEKVALRFEGREVSYAELEERVARAAGWLRDHGVGRGARLAFLGPNCPELLALFFACGRIGAIFVPLNARMPAPELQTFLDLSEPALLVAEKSSWTTVTGVGSAPSVRQTETFVIGDGSLTGSELRADPDADPSSPLLIAFTSGTTGTPKGAVHSNAGVISNAADAVRALGITSSDEVLTVLPMFHVAGLNVLTLPALASGATVTIHRRFEPRMVLEDIERLRVTLFLGAPPITVAMAAEPGWDAADLSELRALLIGGTIVTDGAIRAWRERGVPVVQGYGMTEVLAVSFVPLPAVPRKSLTAGKPTLSTRFRIIDRSGRDLPHGEPGQVTVRGPSVTTGYWRNDAATREAIPDGWFRTGDFGFLDDEGFLHIIDRIKEIIIVGTSNVYPADVEAVLIGSSEIADAAVVGAPDEELGEVPVAFVVLAAGASMEEDEVLKLFEGRLAAYKHPRRVIFVDVLPRTSVGKVEKKSLRALASMRATTMVT
jgi:fatty-acyl-CoA synthase